MVRGGFLLLQPVNINSGAQRALPVSPVVLGECGTPLRVSYMRKVGCASNYLVSIAALVTLQLTSNDVRSHHAPQRQFVANSLWEVMAHHLFRPDAASPLPGFGGCVRRYVPAA